MVSAETNLILLLIWELTTSGLIDAPVCDTSNFALPTLEVFGMIRKHVTFSGVFVGLALTSVAFANSMGQLELKFNNIPLGKTASVYSDGEKLTDGVRVGTMRLEVNPHYTGTWGEGEEIVSQADNDQILAFCVDIHQDASSYFKIYDVYEAPYSYINQTQTNDLLSLFSNYFDDVTDNDTAAAFQFCVWEIINETSGVYDIFDLSTRGSFYTTTSGEFTGIANDWLGNLGQATPGLELQILANPKYQDYGITAVPEPFTMVSLALGSVVMLRRPRKRKR